MLILKLLVCLSVLALYFYMAYEGKKISDSWDKMDSEEKEDSNEKGG